MDVVKKKCGVECEAYSSIKKHDDDAECQTRQEHQKREETRKRLVLPGINKLVRRQHQRAQPGQRARKKKTEKP